MCVFFGSILTCPKSESTPVFLCILMISNIFWGLILLLVGLDKNEYDTRLELEIKYENTAETLEWDKNGKRHVKRKCDLSGIELKEYK